MGTFSYDIDTHECHKLKENVKAYRRVGQSDRSSFECDECEKTSNNNDRMKNHNKSIHVEKETREEQQSILGSFHYECESCDKMFDETIDLEEHIESDHTSDAKHKCQQCDQTFKHEDNLKNHIGISHTESPLEGTFINPSITI